MTPRPPVQESPFTMCGIAAIIRSADSDAHPWPAPILARMDRAIATLSRRGPNGHAVRSVANNHALLGHTRLAIQDLSENAAQPMSTPDGSLTITYNGEIYNAPDLRRELESLGHTFRTRSDTEVLLNAIAQWGPRPALDKLRGMFAFVAVQYDHARTTIFAAVDPAGMKPIAWTLVPNPDAPGATQLLIASDWLTVGWGWVIVLSLSVLGTFGLNALFRPTPESQRKVTRILIVLLAILASVFVAFSTVALNTPMFQLLDAIGNFDGSIH